MTGDEGDDPTVGSTDGDATTAGSMDDDATVGSTDGDATTEAPQGEDAVPVTVYSREDCHLCAQAVETLERAAAAVAVPVAIEEVDVDEDPQLRAEYGDRVPYVLVAGRPAFKFRVDPATARQRLRGAAE